MVLSLYCLNVGQANSLVVLDPLPGGHQDAWQAVVVDVGVDGSRLANWLHEVGVRLIPLILLTHNDDDHIFGLPKLVEGFRKRVGKLRFVIDRDPNDIPCWLPAQAWKAQGIIHDVDEIRASSAATASRGTPLFTPPEGSYWLFCLYPNVFQNRAAVAGAKMVGPRPRKGPNATSAVFGLSTSARPRKWRVLFGGDLDLPGWRCLVDDNRLLTSDVLVVPHHGGPRHPTRRFGFADLADAVRPTYALISVGTDQSFGHPLPDLVRELCGVSATVLCTQLTTRCVDQPHDVPGRSVLPLTLLTDPTDLTPSGTACAGTVAVVIHANRPPSVLRVSDHQAAVDALLTANHHPLCRP